MWTVFSLIGKFIRQEEEGDRDSGHLFRARSTVRISLQQQDPGELKRTEMTLLVPFPEFRSPWRMNINQANEMIRLTNGRFWNAMCLAEDVINAVGIVPGDEDIIRIRFAFRVERRFSEKEDNLPIWHCEKRQFFVDSHG
jgi:hypothetical protein